MKYPFWYVTPQCMYIKATTCLFKVQVKLTWPLLSILEKLTLALIGVLRSGSTPWPVPMVSQTVFTVGSVCTMLAEAHHSRPRLRGFCPIRCLLTVALHTMGSMTIALTSRMHKNWLNVITVKTIIKCFKTASIWHLQNVSYVLIKVTSKGKLARKCPSEHNF